MNTFHCRNIIVSIFTAKLNRTVCFNCVDVSKPSDCDVIEICDVDKVTTIYPRLIYWTQSQVQWQPLIQYTFPFFKVLFKIKIKFSKCLNQKKQTNSYIINVHYVLSFDADLCLFFYFDFNNSFISLWYFSLQKCFARHYITDMFVERWRLGCEDRRVLVSFISHYVWKMLYGWHNLSEYYVKDVKEQKYIFLLTIMNQIQILSIDIV